MQPRENGFSFLIERAVNGLRGHDLSWFAPRGSFYRANTHRMVGDFSAFSITSRDSVYPAHN
jgi:hypothetical protein